MCCEPGRCALQRAYLPHWLGAPLVRLKTSPKLAPLAAAEVENTAMGLPPIAEDVHGESGRVRSAGNRHSSRLRRRPSADSVTDPVPITGDWHSSRSELPAFVHSMAVSIFFDPSRMICRISDSNRRSGTHIKSSTQEMT